MYSCVFSYNTIYLVVTSLYRENYIIFIVHVTFMTAYSQHIPSFWWNPYPSLPYCAWIFIWFPPYITARCGITTCYRRITGKNNFWRKIFSHSSTMTSCSTYTPYTILPSLISNWELYKTLLHDDRNIFSKRRHSQAHVIAVRNHLTSPTACSSDSRTM